MRTVIIAALLGIAVAWPLGQVIAQTPPTPGAPDTVPEQIKPEAPTPPSPPPREHADPLEEKDLRQLIETVRMVRLSQQLGLNDEQTVLMMRKFDRYREDVAQMRRDRTQLIRELKEATKAGKPDAEIEAALQKLVEQDRKIAEGRLSAFEDAGKDLNAAQRAKLYVFVSEFEDDIRRLVQRARQAGPERLMRFREMRDNAFGRPEGRGGPEEGPDRPLRPRPGGPGMRGPDNLNPPPPGETPPPPQ